MRRKGGQAALLLAAALLAAGTAGGCKNTSYEPIEITAQEKSQETPASEAQAQSSQKETAVTKETAPAYTETEDTVYIAGDRVNVRTSGNLSGQVVATLSRGTALTRTGVGEGWSRVVYNGQECYVSNDYVTAKAPDNTQTADSEKAAEGKSTADSASGEAQAISLDPQWQYAGMAKITSGSALLYRAESNRKGIVVCVNAGHGTKGGSSVKTLCHPDGSAKVTGGTTQAGATTAVAVSSGMTFADGTPEHQVTLALALKLKEKLLADGYDVLMIRETEDVQLDNVARTVIANNAADCHIALHWDSTESNKGAFYMSVPSNETYRNMEPVKSHWQQHNALGESLIAGLKSAGVKIFSGGSMEMDLTQTSYSTVPSIDIELGDKVSDHSASTLDTLASGLLAGINQYFGQ